MPPPAPSPAVRSALEATRRRSGWETALFIRLSRVGGDVRITGAHGVGSVPAPLDRRALVGRSLSELGWTATELLPIDRTQEGRLTLRDAGAWRTCGGLVSLGGRVLGWMGVLTTRLRAPLPDDLGVPSSPDALACTTDADPDALSPAWLVITPGGHIERWSPEAGPWLSVETLRPAVTAAAAHLSEHGAPRCCLGVGGHLIHLTALFGGSDTSVLVQLQPGRAPAVPVTATLTRCQLEVASYAACGATNQEIGLQLDRSIETVRSHIKAVYRALGIGSRAELATIMHAAWPTGA